MNIGLRLAKSAQGLLAIFLILVSIACLITAVVIFHVAGDLPKLPSPLSRIIETPQSQILAAGGQVLATLGERKTIPLDRVSQHFINAIVATEDHRFFEHHGINKLRTIKGLYVTLFKPGKIQGASTITQQLAKNMFFSFEKTFSRKLKELLVALQIEASCTKEEILHAYVNQIHFGAGAQGIEQAAQVYFGKPALDLTLPEAALLAGLPKSPTYYNPFRYYERSLERRDIVLKRMVQAGFISSSEAKPAMENRPQLNGTREDSRTGSYFVDALIQDLISKYGEDVVYYGGIKVFATIDLRLQGYAQKAVRQGLDRLDGLMGLDPKNPDRPQGALVAVDNGSGAVKAMVGGRDYYTSEFNRAVNSRRQPGSGFKPFLYYAAFKRLGVSPATVMTDQAVTIPVKGAADWDPQNFGSVYQGDMVLKKALALSVNSIAAQLVEKVGPDEVVSTAKICGITTPLTKVFSIALGTSTVTPFEMAAAYSTFANLGVRHQPFLFWRVEDAFGRVLFEQIVQEKRVLDPAVTYQLVDMMKSVIEIGSGKSIRQMGFDRAAAGKTGTTDNYNDAWFTGFTPTLSTCVWTGFDRKRKLIDKNGSGITGGRGAAPIWAEFMIAALASEPERDFAIPGHIRFETIDTRTGCTPGAENPEGETMRVALTETQVPCREDLP